MYQVKAKILANTELNHSPGFFLIELAAPDIAGSAQPGQFAMLSAGVDSAHFLKRPMAIAMVDQARGSICFIYQRLGKGTQALAAMQPGNSLELLGPLGNGWHIEEKQRRICLVGGGSGLASLLPLAIRLQSFGARPDIILGGKDSSKIICRDTFASCGYLHLATEDGSAGELGMVDIHLAKDADYQMVYSCGPTPMMRAVAAWAKRLNLPCQVSLEERMGCGYGVCVGCVCKVKSPEGSLSHQRVCCDGPVFNSQEVFFDD